MVITFESVDEILWCDHLNETSSALLLRGTICFSTFYKMKFGIFLEFRFFTLLVLKGLTFFLLKPALQFVLSPRIIQPQILNYPKQRC